MLQMARKLGTASRSVRQRARRMAVGFARDDSGAMTVDYVVLTAAIIGLSLVVLTSVGSATTEAAVRADKCLDNIGRKIQRDDLGYTQALRRAGRRCSRF